VLSTRPKVAELAFQVFGRALHPELFEVHKSGVFSRGNYTAKIDITSSGHVVTWKSGGLLLTEVACSAQHPLPQKRRLISYRLRGERADHIDCRGGVNYRMSFQLETVTPQMLQWFQQELKADAPLAGLSHRFEASGRMHLGGQTFIHVEMRQKSLKVQAIHTFPDDYAVVKTESLFQLPGK
jgi:Protein of unknown function DUF2617